MDNLTASFVQNTQNLLFTYFDYSFFIALLVLSTLIGIYYGFVSKHKQNTTDEYIFGNKTMQTFPVAASMIASHISGITLLGIPVEVYANGTQYSAFIISSFIVGVSMIYIYLPVYHELQLTSIFTYLERRFDRRVRLIASAICTISAVISLPIVVYVPALAFSQVTGFNLHLITPFICIVCVFYTTIGGLRAVVWADTLQFLLMLGAIFSLIALGIMAVGWSEIWEAGERGGRLIFFNLDPSPFVRTSFWTILFGLTIDWISCLGINQGCVQRFMALPNLEAAKRSVWIFVFGLIVIKACACFTGVLMYAKYEHCDPLLSGAVQKRDQILPLYVMDVGSSIPGLPGLFIAGIFSAALSTMSSTLNTMAGTIYEDFLKIRLPTATERQASNTMKIIVVVLGIIMISLVFVVEKMGSVFQMTVGISGTTSGALLGMYTIGMISRKANTKGVVAGSIFSILFVAFMLIGSQIYNVNKKVSLPMNIDGCDDSSLIQTLHMNFTTAGTTTTSLPAITNPPDTPFADPDDVFWLFRISFMYYSLTGLIITFAVAYPVSWMTGGTDDLDEILLTPIFRSAEYKSKQRQMEGPIQYAEIGTALVELKKLDDD